MRDDGALVDSLGRALATIALMVGGGAVVGHQVGKSFKQPLVGTLTGGVLTYAALLQYHKYIRGGRQR